MIFVFFAFCFPSLAVWFCWCAQACASWGRFWIAASVTSQMPLVRFCTAATKYGPDVSEERCSFQMIWHILPHHFYLRADGGLKFQMQNLTCLFMDKWDTNWIPACSSPVVCSDRHREHLIVLLFVMPYFCVMLSWREEPRIRMPRIKSACAPRTKVQKVLVRHQ